MPPLVCPSPNILDQSFPRSIEELRLVSKALGRLTQGLEQQEFGVVLTKPIRDFIASGEFFDWSKIREFPQLQAIYYALAQLGLQQAGVQSFDLSGVLGYRKHPVPKGCLDGIIVDDWADEIGRLYLVHHRCADRIGFIGVACTHAFAEEPLGEYENPEDQPCFPLVGPDQVHALNDSEFWDVPDDVSRRNVSFDDAKKKICLLGGVVTKPSGGSHYQVKFAGHRTWPLDANHPEVPERYLRELREITGFDLPVIKYVLLLGKWPTRKSHLRGCL
jgi:hypothetical protein